jgi:hypothetical protein
VESGGLAIHADHETAMAGMAQFSSHFLEYGFHFMKVDVAWKGMAEQAVQNLAVLVIHGELLMLPGICQQPAPPP